MDFYKLFKIEFKTKLLKWLFKWDQKVANKVLLKFKWRKWSKIYEIKTIWKSRSLKRRVRGHVQAKHLKSFPRVVLKFRILYFKKHYCYCY